MSRVALAGYPAVGPPSGWLIRPDARLPEGRREGPAERTGVAGLPPFGLILSGAVPALVAPQHDMRGFLASAAGARAAPGKCIAITPLLRLGMDPGRKHP